jgi:23S rRNA (uracil1939-C5)-methyltransferase
MGRSRKKSLKGSPPPPVLNEDGTPKVYPPPPRLYVESLDLEAQGIAHRVTDDEDNGKVVFIEGALPYETVSAQVHRKKNQWEAGTVTAIHIESSQRVTPGCPHFGLHQGSCGGCKMQHLDAAAQVAVKARALEDQLWHLGKVKPELVLRPIAGPSWGYRYRARLSVRYVIKKGEVLIGFHERKSRYVADIKSCAILVPHVSAMLMPLRALIASMDARETCPQIELACGDTVTAMVLRHLEPLSDGDLAKLRAFATEYNVQWWLQAKGPETVKLLDEPTLNPAQTSVHPEPASGLTRSTYQQVLSYALPDFGITMPFKPTDFTQVNPQINRVLVTRALRLLEVQKHERVIDWFCGLGNFTLPLATQAREVLGIEGSETLVARANDNYQLNKAAAQQNIAQAATQFVARNLFEMTGQMLVADGAADKWLVDPPREGAFALMKALADLHQQRLGNPPDIEEGKAAPLPGDLSTWTPPQRIVYISCNPATLARDAGLLVHSAGYRCTAAGMVNMFPHTAHVESMAVFELAENL